ncbi:PHP domain-containing protein [Candidatus Woesearchaeota archaeon]|jgi:putative hydrolase|nr:PHP domain-containing protein [Candidatus Woesearchaeota archaeon]MBT4368090.1 PHP domain-containing protein [Candidatus Woesearchaeota archaeon]MBT4712578.1 PHP domain-containing protein [Candidatus Woesearchaeota archaeon]MBT6639491.1 PHP domain-containing protein [Candidatus Woesearchaeota archaeon]MBT7133663.1 PHP domain-containing protein [Candidatus Woesearchaeota archaeon]
MLKADLHTHSVLSGHAFASAYELIDEAIKKGLKLLAITEHGPLTPNSLSLGGFYVLHRAPRKVKGLDILWGAEANFKSDGTIDLDEKAINRLDLLNVGLHPGNGFVDQRKEKNTEVILKCLDKYPFHIMTHPHYQIYDFDLEAVFEKACEKNILLEINLSQISYMKKENCEKTKEGFKKIIEIVKKNNKKVIVNSDTHFLHELGDDSALEEFKEELGLTEDLIINNNLEELKTFIKSKNLKEYKDES